MGGLRQSETFATSVERQTSATAQSWTMHNEYALSTPKPTAGTDAQKMVVRRKKGKEEG